MAFLEFDGHVVEYNLQPGQQIVIDTGYLAAMDATCQMDIKSVPGLKNMVFRRRGHLQYHYHRTWDACGSRQCRCQALRLRYSKFMPPSK